VLPAGFRASIAAGRSRGRRQRVYNSPFWKRTKMEAERINILANRLADLGGRCTELRRYL